MAYSAGTAFLQVVPSFSGIDKAIARELKNIKGELDAAVNGVGKDMGDSIAKSVKDGLKGVDKQVADAVGGALPKGFDDAAKNAGKSGKKAGDNFSGEFVRSMAAGVAGAEKALPKLTVEVEAEVDQNSVLRATSELSKELEQLGTTIKVTMDQKAFRESVKDVREHAKNLREDSTATDQDIINLDSVIRQLDAVADEFDKAGEKAAEKFTGKFATDFQSGVRAAAANLPEIDLKANPSPVNSAINQIREQLIALGDKRINVDIDEKTAIADLKKLHSQLNDLEQNGTTHEIRVNARAAAEQVKSTMDRALSDIGRIADKWGRRSAEEFAGTFANTVKARLKAGAANFPDIIIKGDTTAVDRNMADIRKEMLALSDKTIRVNLSEGDAITRLNKLREKLEHLAKNSPTVEVFIASMAAMREVDQALEGVNERAENLASKGGRRSGEAFAGHYANSMRAKLKAMLKTLPEIEITADSSDVDKEVDSINKKLKKLSNKRIGIDIDAEKMKAELTLLEARLAALDEKDIDVELKANVTELKRQLAEATGSATLAGAKAGNNFGGAFDTSLRNALRGAKDEISNIEPTVNSTPAAIELHRIKGLIGGLDDDEVRLRFDSAQTIGEVERLRDMLLQISKDATIEKSVRMDAHDATLQLEEFLSKAREVDKQKVDFDVNAAGSAGALAEFGEMLGLSLSRLTVLVALGASLGSAIVPAAAAAAAAIGAIGAAAGAAGAGVGVLAVALSNIGGGVKALQEGQKALATPAKVPAQKNTAKQSTSNIDAIKDAERGLARARLDAGDAARRAARGIVDAHRAARDAARRSAQEIVDAMRACIDADREAKRAREELTQAYEDARRAQEDAALAFKSTLLAQRQATLDLAEAKEDLTRLTANPRATEAEKEQATISFEQRKLQIEELALTHKRMVEDKTKADKVGIDGSDQVVAAVDRVREADEALADAHRRKVEARRAQAESYRLGLERIADAERALADANRRGADGIAGAQRTLVNAHKKVETAAVATGAATAIAANKARDAFDQLSPAAQRFSRFLLGLLENFNTLRTTAQAGLLPGLEAAISGLLKFLPQIQVFAGQVGAALGGIFTALVEELHHPVWQTFFGYIRDTAVPILEGMASFAFDIARGLTAVILAMTPFNGSIGTGLLEMAQSFATWAETLTNSAGYQEFLAYVAENGPIVVDLIKQIGQFLWNVVLAAAPIGAQVVVIFRKLFEMINKLPAEALQAIITGIIAFAVALLAMSGVVTVALNLVPAAFAFAVATMVGIVSGLFFMWREQISTFWTEIVRPLTDKIGHAFQAVGKILQVIWSLAGAFWSIFDTGADESTGKATTFKDAIGGVAVAIEGCIDIVVLLFQIFMQSIDAFIISMNWLIEAFNEFDKWRTGGKNRIETVKWDTETGEKKVDMFPDKDKKKEDVPARDLLGNVNVFGQVTKDSDDAKTAIIGVDKALAGVYKSALTAADALKVYGNIGRMLTPLEYARATAVKVFSDATSTAAQQTQALVDVELARTTELGNKIHAEIAHTTAMQTFTAAAKEVGTTYDINTEAGLRNRAALEGVLKTSVDMYNQDILAGIPREKAQADHDKRITSLGLEKVKGEENIKVVKDYTDAWGKTPGQVETEIVSPGLAEAYNGVVDWIIATRAAKEGLTPGEAEAKYGAALRDPVKFRAQRAEQQRESFFNRRASAAGGPIRGPGTGTSDSIAAWLSSGEYVIPAWLVKVLGVGFFDQLLARRGFVAGGPVFRGPSHKGASVRGKGGHQTWPVMLNYLELFGDIPGLAAGGPVPPTAPGALTTVTATVAQVPAPLGEAQAAEVEAAALRIQAALALVAESARVAWQLVIAPALEALRSTVVDVLTPTLENFAILTVAPVWERIKESFTAGQLHVATQLGMFQIAVATAGVRWDEFHLLHIEPTWKKIEFILTTFGAFITTAVVPQFERGVGLVAKAFEAVKAAAKGPIEYVMKTVIIGGLLAGYNALAKTFNVEPKDVGIPWPPEGWNEPVKAATGGLIRGPGGDTDDRIPAWLSNNEYVIPARVVRERGVGFFDDLVGRRRRPRTGGPVNVDATGGVGTQSWQQLTAFAKMSGVPFHVGSAYLDRIGGSTYHAKGNAIDMDASLTDMVRLARWLMQFAPNMLELIHSGGPGFFVKHGRVVGPYAVADHYDHVHAAMTNAGIAAALGGNTIPLNEEGMVDPVGPLRKTVNDLLGKIPGAGAFVSLAKGVGAKALDGIAAWLTSKLPTFSGSTDSADANVAEIAIRVGKAMGASRKVMLALFEAGIVESNMRNLNYGDRDSVGYLQQRPSMGWPSPMNIEVATRSFLTKAMANEHAHATAGNLAQSVQISGKPWRYDEEQAKAAALLARYGYDAGGMLPVGVSQVINATGKPEAVLTHRQWQDVAKLVRQPDASVGATYNFEFKDTTLTPGRLRALQDREAALHRTGRAR